MQEEDDVKEILEKAKGKTNLILANIKAIGMKGKPLLFDVYSALVGHSELHVVYCSSS